MPAGTGVWVVNTQRARASRERRPRAAAPVRHPIGGELERSERRVALVEVEDARLDPEHPQRPDGADPEQGVLAEARERVALVEPRGDPAVDRVVLVELGVEEVQRDAADLRPPDMEGDRAAVERKLTAERLAVVVEHLDGRQVLRERSASSTRAGSPERSTRCWKYPLR